MQRGGCQPELCDRSLRAPNYGEQIPELRGNRHPNYGETPRLLVGGGHLGAFLGTFQKRCVLFGWLSRSHGPSLRRDTSRRPLITAVRALTKSVAAPSLKMLFVVPSLYLELGAPVISGYPASRRAVRTLRLR